MTMSRTGTDRVRRIMVALACLAVMHCAAGQSGGVRTDNSAPGTASDPIPVRQGDVFSVPIEPVGNGCGDIRSPAEVRLLIEGIDSGIRALGCDPSNGRLAFRLARDEDAVHSAATDVAWDNLSGRPWNNHGVVVARQRTFTAVTGEPMRSVAHGVLLVRVVHGVRMAVGAALMVLLWGGLIVLAIKSAMLRDMGTSTLPLAQRPFSLSRVQMVWWFAIVIGSYVFLWAITGTAPTLTAQALSLAGLSGVTGLASVSIDVSKQTQVAASGPGRFLMDLLGGAEGVTVYRFQMVVLTVILGAFFVVSVFANLAMPELDGGQLTLLAISSGTYLGFKMPENRQGGVPDGSLLKGATGSAIAPQGPMGSATLSGSGLLPGGGATSESGATPGGVLSVAPDTSDPRSRYSVGDMQSNAALAGSTPPVLADDPKLRYTPAGPDQVAMPDGAASAGASSDDPKARYGTVSATATGAGPGSASGHGEAQDPRLRYGPVPAR